MTVREPAATPTIVTQSRLAQTDPWIPSPVSDKPADDSNNEFQTMMQARVEALERKYQTIIEQKNSQIQQLTQEVFKKTNISDRENIDYICFFFKGGFTTKEFQE